MPAIGRYTGACLSRETPSSPREGFSPILMRFAIDDLRPITSKPPQAMAGRRAANSAIGCGTARGGRSDSITE